MSSSERPIRSAITQLAADWFAAHRGGPLSHTARDEFLGWLKASPIHIEEYLGVAALEPVLRDAARDPPISIAALKEMAQQEDDATIVDLVSSLPAAPARSPAAPVADEPARNGWRLWFASAAVVIVSLGGLYALWHTFADRWPLAYTYVTAHGQRQSWQLPDGSTLQLDTDSAVTVRLGAAQRLVMLERGQIAVTVQHDPQRPFQVRAGGVEASAVGTRFDVYRMQDSTVVSVWDGLVSVSVPQNATRAVSVAAGQKLSIVGDVLPLAPSPANTRETKAWLAGKITFERRALGEVAAEFNRYNTMQFSIDDPQLRELPISGSFDAQDIDSFADFLGSVEGVRLQRSDSGFKVLRATSSSGAPRASRPP